MLSTELRLFPDTGSFEETSGVRLPNPANVTIGISVFIGLALIVILILALAHAWAPEAAPDLPRRCFETFETAQWPKWIGCAMAARESLAAGLIGAAGALFAAWLAYSAVQQQFAHQEAERARLQAEAKEAAVVSLTQIVHAAGSTWGVVREALRRDKELEQQGVSPQSQPRIGAMASATDFVNQGMKQIRMALDHWSLREVAKDLAVDDRAALLRVVLTLESIINIASQRLSQNIGPRDRLKEQEKALSSIQKHLSDFDADLAKAYASDAGM
jgi:hypothetical protein